MDDLELKLEEPVKKPGKIRELFNWSKNHINYKLGSLGAAFGGALAYYSNYEHGTLQSSLAFAKQAAFVFILGGYNSRTCEKIVKRIKSKFLALTAATIGATAQAGALMYLYHEILRTPNAAETALTLSTLNLPGFLWLAYYCRKNHDKGVKGMLQ